MNNVFYVAKVLEIESGFLSLVVYKSYYAVWYEPKEGVRLRYLDRRQLIKIRDAINDVLKEEA